VRALAPLLAALLVACGPRATPGARSPTTVPPASHDHAADTTDVAALVRESYRFLERGYDNVYLDGLRSDGHLLVFDTAPGEVFVGYDPRLTAARRVFDDEEPYELWGKRLTVTLAADGSAPWTHDDLSQRVRRGNRRAIIPLRATALFERRDGRWMKSLEHVSYALPEEEAAARATPIPTSIPEESAAGEAARVRDLLLAHVRGDVSARSLEAGALALGVSAVRELRGAAIAEAPSLAALAGATGATPLGLRVVLGETGAVAWAAAVLRVTAPGGAYEVRATWVLEQRAGAWRIVQTHVSAPVPEAIIAARVFGE
jgi:hypothetical protein